MTAGGEGSRAVAKLPPTVGKINASMLVMPPYAVGAAGYPMGRQIGPPDAARNATGATAGH